MMMIIMDFTGFPASTVATQSRGPKFSLKAGFRVVIAVSGKEAEEHVFLGVCRKRTLRNPTIKPSRT